MKQARIYQKPKSSMQSGKSTSHEWWLEFERTEPRVADPLTGWAGSGDTRTQIRLGFATLAAAEAYATKEGLNAVVVPAAEKALKLQAYADNFK